MEEKSKKFMSNSDDEDILFGSMLTSNGIPLVEIDNKEIYTDTKIENNTENIDVRPAVSETTDTAFTSNMPLNIKTAIHEEIFEFDLADPITEPVSVEEGPEDFSVDNSIVKNFTSEEIPQLNLIEDMPEKSDDLNKALQPETSNNEGLQTACTSSQSEDSEDLIVEIAVDSKTSLEECNSQESEFLNEHPEDLKSESLNQSCDESFDDTCLEEDELDIEIGELLHDFEKNSGKINQLIMSKDALSVEIDTSREHITLINTNEEYMKHQHSIMDNRCISLFWPVNGSTLSGSRISISTEKDKTFIIDIDKIDISLLNVLMHSQRPIKVFYNVKPVILWCKANNLYLKHIFDVSTALNILTEGKSMDNCIKSLVHRYSNRKLESENIDFQDFVIISKFILSFRKKLVDSFEDLGIIDVLNLEQRILFAVTESEFNGMPYNEAVPNPLVPTILELVESKYGITSKKELSKTGILSFHKTYLNERTDSLEVQEYMSAENSENIRQQFDSKYAFEGRIKSTLEYGPCASIIAKNYSFCGEGIYSFITPSNDCCLVEGRFRDLEIRVIAKLINKPALLKSFFEEEGPYAYFASPIFGKNSSDLTLDDKFKTKMIIETIVRNLGDRETLSYIWNTYQSCMKEDEIFSLKEKFKHAHPEFINFIQKTQEQAKSDGYITTSTGRIAVIKNENKAFHMKLEMYMNDIFKMALESSYHDMGDYNANFPSKIKLCTIYNRIITFECSKSIVNTSIDILTRNMTKAAAKILRGIPVSLKVCAGEQFEA